MTQRSDRREDALVTDVKVRIVENGTSGLVAWASCVVAEVVKLQNIGVRRGERGLFLTYPRKDCPNGEKLQYFHPVNKKAAEAIDEAVLTCLAKIVRLISDAGEHQP